MTDYQPLLARAIGNLERNTGEARRAVYDRARQALLNQLRAITPSLSDPEITRERLALEDAIRKIETQAAQANPEPARSSRPMPTGTRPAVPTPPLPSARGASGSPRPPSREAVPSVRPAPPMSGATPKPPMPPRAPLSGGPAVPAPRTPSAGGREGTPQPRPMPPRGREPVPANGERSRNEVQGELPRSGTDAKVAPEGLDHPREEELLLPNTDAQPPREGRPSVDEFAAAPRARRPQLPPGAVSIAEEKGGARGKLLVGGLVLLLFVAAGLLAYIQRDRVLALFGAGSPTSQVASDADRGKAEDRVSPQAGAPPRSGAPAAPPATQAPPVGQTATLYEENPGGAQQFQNFAGTVVWRTETVAVGPGRAPDLALRADIDIPDRKMNVRLILRRNMDSSFPASHTLEILFTNPGDPFGGVSNVRGLRAKNAEAANGSVFGLSEPEKIKDGDILFALPDTQLDQNIQLLRERPWFDIAFFYNNGRRAVLAFEKGTPGDRAVSQALAAWGQGG